MAKSKDISEDQTAEKLGQAMATEDWVTGSPEIASRPAETDLSLTDLAKKHGHFLKLGIDGSGDPPFSPHHLAASVHNKWSVQEHTTGQEVKLSDAAYLAAIEAAKKHVPTPKKKGA